jgi:hypothetical protein
MSSKREKIGENIQAPLSATTRVRSKSRASATKAVKTKLAPKKSKSPRTRSTAKRVDPQVTLTTDAVLSEPAESLPQIQEEIMAASAATSERSTPISLIHPAVVDANAAVSEESTLALLIKNPGCRENDDMESVSEETVDTSAPQFEEEATPGIIFSNESPLEVQAVRSPWKRFFADLAGKVSRLFSHIKVTRAQKRLRVCESVSLGEKRFVAVIQVDGEEFLVGGASNSISTLARLDRSQKFSDVLRQQWSEDPASA